ncbi:DUF2975 domain-containing protein [Spirillospora sp. NBC_00431]
MNIKSLWRRLDSLALEAVLGLTLLLVSLFGVLLPILGVTSLLSSTETHDVRIDGTAQIPSPGALSADAMTLRGTDNAALTFTHPSVAERLLLILPGVTNALLLGVILGLLVRMAGTFRSGDAFVPQNARYLNGIALAVLLMGVLVPLLHSITTNILISGTPFESKIKITYEISALWVLAAILIAGVAGAFRHGTRLRDDVEGLV